MSQHYSTSVFYTQGNQLYYRTAGGSPTDLGTTALNIPQDVRATKGKRVFVGFNQKGRAQYGRSSVTVLSRLQTYLTDSIGSTKPHSINLGNGSPSPASGSGGVFSASPSSTVQSDGTVSSTPSTTASGIGDFLGSIPRWVFFAIGGVILFMWWRKRKGA